MTTTRIFSPQPLREKQLYCPGEDQQHYLRHVLRVRIGDTITLFDGSGSDYQGVVERLDARELVLRIINRVPIAVKACRLTLAQALPKGSKMDDIVEKATELGVDRIVPFHSSRSVPRWSVEKGADRIVRWRKIAIEAARRCRRSDIPSIESIVPYEDMLGMAMAAGQGRKQGHDQGGDRGRVEPEMAAPRGPLTDSGTTSSENDFPVGRIIFWEEGGRSVKSILHHENSRQTDHLFLVIGPEGGFSRDEIRRAQERGFVVAGLGDQVLRVETASLVALAIVQYELGIFSEVRT